MPGVQVRAPSIGLAGTAGDIGWRLDASIADGRAAAQSRLVAGMPQGLRLEARRPLGGLAWSLASPDHQQGQHFPVEPLAVADCGQKLRSSGLYLWAEANLSVEQMGHQELHHNCMQ